MRHSCALTLSRKLRLKSRKKVFKKFGKNLKEPNTKTELAIPKDFKNTINNFNTNQNFDPLKIVK